MVKFPFAFGAKAQIAAFLAPDGTASDRAARGRLDWDGRMLIVRSAATDSLAEGDEVFVIADPRSCALLEE